MTETSSARVDQTGHTCWCCGATRDERDLTRLGSHPEVGICLTCARWLHRRARARAESSRGTPGPVVRRSVQRVRQRVVGAGLHDRPVLGPLLRTIDRHLP